MSSSNTKYIQVPPNKSPVPGFVGVEIPGPVSWLEKPEMGPENGCTMMYICVAEMRVWLKHGQNCVKTQTFNTDIPFPVSF